MTSEAYYIYEFKKFLSTRKEVNSAYSLRAMARDIGLHSSTLSHVMSGKRSLPLKKANDVSLKLELSPKEKALFLESIYESRSKLSQRIAKDQRFVVDESNFRVLAEWEHFAALELFEFQDYVDFNENFVSKKLGISQRRANEVVLNLLQAKLISFNQVGKFKKSHLDVRTTEDITSDALKKSHAETLNLALKKLTETDIQLRDYSSATVAIDLKKIPETKKIIREFRYKLTKLLESGDKSEIYQLAIQFFPLTSSPTEDSQCRH